MQPCRILVGCILASLAALSGGASTQVITEFSAGISPGAISFSNSTAGPDGNVWFTEPTINRIGRITPLGVVTEFSTGSSPIEIAAAADGNLWFTTRAASIGRMTPLGIVTIFPVGIPAQTRTGSITSGLDGNIWFTELPNPGPPRIGRITPLGVVTEFDIGNIVAGSITSGPDGNLWFTVFGPAELARITTTGTVTRFSIGDLAEWVTAGPDGNLWFTDIGDRIGRMTPTGVVTYFSTGITYGAHPSSITAGPDGNLWFTEPGINRIARITNPAYASIPTLQVWALGVLVLTLMLVGIRRARRG